MNCVRCDKPIEQIRHAFQEVIGYARPKIDRADGTGSSLIGRHPTGNLLCRGCAVSVQHGANQEGLF